MSKTNPTLLPLLLFMGVLNSTMVFLNGMLAGYTDLYLSGLIVHIVGFIPAFIMFIMFDRKNAEGWKEVLRKDRKIFTSGFIGAILLIISAFCIIKAGVFVTSIAMVAGQFISSVVVDLKGYFGFPKIKLRLTNYISIALIVAGILLISM